MGHNIEWKKPTGTKGQGEKCLRVKNVITEKRILEITSNGKNADQDKTLNKKKKRRL